MLNSAYGRDWWLDVPSYARLPDPLFYIPFSEEWGDYEIPVVVLPEQLIDESLRRLGVVFYAFLGFLAPPGNGKRIPAAYMFTQAKKAGIIIPGQSRVIEPTSGNMGLSMAYCAKRAGVDFTAVVSDRTPEGKVEPIRRQGAAVLRESELRRHLGIEGALSGIDLCRMDAERNGTVFLNQYANPWNWEAYYYQVADPYFSGIAGQSRFSVIASGSAGTLVGLGRRWKERCPGFRMAATIPYNGQDIGGMRSRERRAESTQPWQDVTDIDEPIDYRVAERMSEECDKAGLPIGGSGGASIATANHLLVEMSPEQREALRTPDGRIGVMLYLADTRYPYL